MRQQFADRRIDLRQTMEDSMAQPAKQPPLDDEDRLGRRGLAGRMAVS
jgi:hypothetical protein